MTDDVDRDSGVWRAPPVPGVGGPGEDFTEAAARGFIGRRYRSTAQYSGVEPGSIGTVCDIYSRGGGRFGVDVTWEGIDVERGGLTDGFSWADLALVFTGGPNKGRRAMVPLDGPDGLECDPAPVNGGGRTRVKVDLRAIKDRVAERRQQFPSEQAAIADLDELIAEVERYRDLCLRLTLGAGSYAGQPLLGGGRTPDYLGSGVGSLGGHYCIWCGAIREADDRHSADCPWPEVLEEGRGAVDVADGGFTDWRGDELQD
jgi:hypothetical protein